MTDINKNDDSAALAAVIATSLDGIFGTRNFGPATQDVKLAEAIHAAGWTRNGAMHAALTEISEERIRQDAKWGEQNHPDGTGPDSQPLDEMWWEVPESGPFEENTAKALAESATATTDRHATHGVVTWSDILLEEVFEALAESDPVKLRTELIQVAAVATQWAEAIDRREVGE